jgi:hypothetical protein
MRILSWPPVVFITGIPPDECTRRLKADVGWGFIPFSQAEVVGSVGKRWFRLRRNIWYRNSFQPVAAGTLEESGIGTRISCRFRVNLMVQAFAIFFVLISTASTAMSLRNLADCVFSIGMVALVTGFIAFSRWLARGEPEFLTHYLRDLLDAQIEQ